VKPVKIRIAKNMGWNKPTKMLDWEAFSTIIPGLYLARPMGKDELPEKKGWNVIHKSGGYINPIILKSEKKAKEFISALDSKGLNWGLSLEELKANYSRPFSEYSKAVREVWENGLK
jgi:hypothetical protein